MNNKQVSLENLFDFEVHSVGFFNFDKQFITDKNFFVITDYLNASKDDNKNKIVDFLNKNGDRAFVIITNRGKLGVFSFKNKAIAEELCTFTQDDYYLCVEGEKVINLIEKNGFYKVK